jgi:hypothetical protein
MVSARSRVQARFHGSGHESVRGGRIGPTSRRDSLPAARESIPDAAGRRSLRCAKSFGLCPDADPAGVGTGRAVRGAQEDLMANIQHSTNGSSLAEVIDRILDRGCVIDAFVRVTLVGIELLAIEARVVIASVDTWLKYAEAVGLTTTFDQMTELPA